MWIVLVENFKLRLLHASLPAFVDKYGVSISQWVWLCQALWEVSMNKKALWINICADDWAAEMSTIASNADLIRWKSLYFAKLEGIDFCWLARFAYWSTCFLRPQPLCRTGTVCPILLATLCLYRSTFSPVSFRTVKLTCPVTASNISAHLLDSKMWYNSMLKCCTSNRMPKMVAAVMKENTVCCFEHMGLHSEMLQPKSTARIRVFP